MTAPGSHLLLLAGSAEGRDIAGRIFAAGAPRTLVSLARPPRHSGMAGLPLRIGGFGGAEGFSRLLDEQRITAVLDATHPFAQRISARSLALCRAAGLPFAQVLRPPWRPGPGDDWTEVADTAEAARRTPAGARVFATTGRGLLDGLAGLRGGTLFLRQLGAGARPPAAVKGVVTVPGEGPFSVEDEIALFRDLAIDALVVKNSGGQASRSKLDAARALGLPVFLLRRPPPLDAPRLETVDQAMAWLESVT